MDVIKNSIYENKYSYIPFIFCSESSYAMNTTFYNLLFWLQLYRFWV